MRGKSVVVEDTEYEGEAAWLDVGVWLTEEGADVKGEGDLKAGRAWSREGHGEAGGVTGLRRSLMRKDIWQQTRGS